MPQRTLTHARLWLVASLAAGLGYWFLKDSSLPDLYRIGLKGAGVALLACYALARHVDAHARDMAVVMALGALGDVSIEFALEAGAVAFLAGHVVAIRLYWRQRRVQPNPSTALAGWALVLLTPLGAWWLSGNPLTALYGLGLGVMAASAWTSSFPRQGLGLGALLFVASDLLLFARMGPLAASALPDLLVWPLYYFGQFLICTGVVGRSGANQ